MDTQTLLEETRFSPLSNQTSTGMLGLRFAPELETRYQRHRARMTAQFTQFGTGLGLLMVIALLVADTFGLGRSFTPAARWIILGFIIPEMTVSLALSLMPRLQQWLALLSSINLMLLTAAFIAVWFIMQRQSPGMSPPYTYEALIFIIVFAYFFAGLRYGYAVFVGLVSAMAFVLSQAYAGLDLANLRYTGLFLFGANLLGMVGLYVIEHSQRHDFLAREMLDHIAQRDPLTGMVNRRTMRFHLRKAWAQGSRDGLGMGVLFIDIDDFKQLNDRNGHDHGDQCVMDLAQLLNKSARRPWDLAARYGGDEFMIFWYDINAQAVRSGVERLLHDVREQEQEFTVSIGAAHIVPGPQDRAEDLLKLADQRLYESKRAGRDRATLE